MTIPIETIELHNSLPRPHRHLDWAIAVAVIGLFCWPLLFSKSGFSWDFTNSMWLGWVQAQAIAATHQPALFIQSTYFGLFSPSYLFYGGAPFVFVGTLSALVGGHFIIVFEVFSLAIVAMTYGGALWLARLARIRGLAAHAIPIAIVTAAYYATDLYGRGAWPEWIGFSCIPLFVASNLALYRGERLRAGPLLGVAVSTVLFTGSHNVILLFGILLGVLVAFAALLLFGRQQLKLRRLLRSLALVGLAGALNSWFLLADIFFGQSTGETQMGGANTFFFDSARALFDPLRFVPNQSSTPGLYVQLPLWFLAWSLVFGPLTFGMLARGPEARVPRRLWQLLTSMTLLIIALIMLTPIWTHLPNIIQDIQFPYRLDGFVYLFLAISLIPLLQILQGFSEQRRRAQFRKNAYGALVVAVLLSVGLCGWQVLFGTRHLQNYALPNRVGALVSPTTPPSTWYEYANVYDDVNAPVINVPTGRTLVLPASAVSPGGNNLLAVVNAPNGPAPIATNIIGGANVLTIGGDFVRVGRTSFGFVVVKRVNDMTGPVYLNVSPASNWQLAGGRDLSLASAGALLVVLGYTLIAPAMRRRRSVLDRFDASDKPTTNQTAEAVAPSGSVVGSML